MLDQEESESRGSSLCPRNADESQCQSKVQLLVRTQSLEVPFISLKIVRLLARLLEVCSVWVSAGTSAPQILRVKTARSQIEGCEAGLVPSRPLQKSQSLGLPAGPPAWHGALLHPLSYSAPPGPPPMPSLAGPSRPGQPAHQNHCAQHQVCFFVTTRWVGFTSSRGDIGVVI